MDLGAAVRKLEADDAGVHLVGQAGEGVVGRVDGHRLPPARVEVVGVARLGRGHHLGGLEGGPVASLGHLVEGGGLDVQAGLHLVGRRGQQVVGQRPEGVGGPSPRRRRDLLLGCALEVDPGLARRLDRQGGVAVAVGAGRGAVRRGLVRRGGPPSCRCRRRRRSRPRAVQATASATRARCRSRRGPPAGGGCALTHVVVVSFVDMVRLPGSRRPVRRRRCHIESEETADAGVRRRQVTHLGGVVRHRAGPGRARGEKRAPVRGGACRAITASTKAVRRVRSLSDESPDLAIRLPLVGRRVRHRLDHQGRAAPPRRRDRYAAVGPPATSPSSACSCWRSRRSGGGASPRASDNHGRAGAGVVPRAAVPIARDAMRIGSLTFVRPHRRSLNRNSYSGPVIARCERSSFRQGARLRRARRGPAFPATPSPTAGSRWG